ncbi:MAG TPA: MFS transporter [Streptosporangiaceae bacterium]|nr:MFS transporter [Streptosporangiaceae bacterium]
MVNAQSTEAYPRRWLMLPVVLLAMFMAGFDIWAVNVAAPSLQRDLHVSDAALQLIVGGYAFMYASGMVTGGRLGDLFGYRRMFMIGVVSFAAASLLCGLAQTSSELVVARLVQGLTGAIMVPQVLALITAAFPARERVRALAWFGVTMGIGFVSGQILGGGLIEANIAGLGWRAIFLVNVPVGILALIAARVVVPRARSSRRARLDPLGALGISGSIALALVPLTLGRDEGWPLWTWISLAAALPVLALTVAWERRLARRGGEPLLDLPLFRDRTFSAGLAVNFGLVMFFGSFMFVLTLLLQAGLGQQPLRAGIEALPLAATFTLMSILSPRFAARLGSRAITISSCITAIGAIGLVVTGLHFGAGLTGWDIAPATALIGLGQGISMPLLIGTVLTHVRPEQAGGAAGILTTTQQFGLASGIAIIGAIFYSALGAAPSRGAFVTGMEVAMTVDAILVVLAAGVTLLLPRRAAAQAAVPAQAPAPEVAVAVDVAG